MIFLYIAWFGRIILNLFSYAHLWWIKEYRFDRMLIHLRSPQGKWILFPPIRRPHFSTRSILLILINGMVLAFFIVLIDVPIFIRFLTADFLLFPLTWFVVGVLHIPTKIYHKVLIARAVRKLREHRKLLTIGVTGSYGKTSIKDYLATILSEKFTVLKTEASKNSPIGIAEVVVRKLRNDHEIFVVEMGAYKRGEIAEMVTLVKPQIGIITAINPQHQDLFGSLENTMKAKYELIQGLVGRKLGIFNADDKRVQQMATRANRDGVEVWAWSKKNVQNIKSDFDSIQFDFHWNGEQTIVRAPILGEHQVMNVSLALLGAVACGMSFKDAERSASNIKPAKGVMQKREGINGATFIDDTFNNNPDAAKAAISFLVKAKARKILIFQPMIELGKYALLAHREVGKLADSLCDEIILTNRSFFNEFPSKKTYVMNVRRAVKYLRETIHKGDTVLFKGKEAGLVLRLCLKK